MNCSRAASSTGRISLLAGEKAIVEKLGHKYQRVEELEDDTEAPRVAYHSKEAVDKTKSALLGSLTPIGALAAAGAIYASGGALAVTLGVGLLGAEIGGFIGGVLGELVEIRRSNPLAQASGARRAAAVGAHPGRRRGGGGHRRAVAPFGPRCARARAAGRVAPHPAMKARDGAAR